ncbi:MAG: hypothetical protein HDR05_08510 [Lachnospiraceae bacterium]|nr:hypothetical protein [Lachnospiraceae bacterium]
MEKAEYVECYVAFLDMLGFKNLINDSSCDEIAGIFAKFSNSKPLKEEYLGDRNIISDNTADALKVKVMSDSICFYIDVNITNALLCIILSCIYFQYELYQNNIPIFLRGAIVRGHLYANKDIIFGPGLTQAYLLEENNTKYPRIILTNETLQSVKIRKEYNLDDHLSMLRRFVFRDDDAFYVVDCIRILFIGDQTIHEKVEKRIEHMLDTTVDSSIREKYLYLEKKLNLAMQRVKIQLEQRKE